MNLSASKHDEISRPVSSSLDCDDRVQPAVHSPLEVRKTTDGCHSSLLDWTAGQWPGLKHSPTLLTVTL